MAQNNATAGTTIVPDADFYRAKARRLERAADMADESERRRCRAEAARLRAAADALQRREDGDG
jgi:hypothetical protein